MNEQYIYDKVRWLSLELALDQFPVLLQLFVKNYQVIS